MSFHDHFSSKSANYAKARPTYPSALFSALAGMAPGRGLAWDAGTGNGQAAVALAAHFERVVATEPSPAQLAQAVAHPRVEYVQAAERAPLLAGGSVDLVTVAQAVHWFDRPTFYAEVQRVLRPEGVIAVWAYELVDVTPEINAILYRFYKGDIKPYWPPERGHIETEYRDIGFPFREVAFPAIKMTHRWTLAGLMGYLRTWSAVTRFAAAKGFDPVDELERTLGPLWGPGVRELNWTLVGRLGRRA